MTRADLLHKLRKFDACAEAIEWVESTEHATLQDAWDSCDRADWMLWLLTRLHPGESRGPIRHAMCDCAETALRFVPAGEDRPARAIEVARRYADGKATDDELAAACNAARAAGAAVWVAAGAAWAAAQEAAWAAAWAARDAAQAAGTAAVDAWAEVAARAAALKDMAALVRKRVPNPEVI